MAKAVTLKNSNGDELYPTTIAELVNGLDEKLEDMFFYKPGDVIVYSDGAPVNGVLTGANGSIWLAVPAQKRLDKLTSATLTQFIAGIRCNNAYLGGADQANFLNLATSVQCRIDKERNCFYVILTKSNGWGGTNNTAVSAGGSKITIEVQ